VQIWTIGRSLEEISRSSQQIVYRETAAPGMTIAFGALGLVMFVILRDWAGAAASLVLFSFALWTTVKSTFTVERRRRLLVTQRLFNSTSEHSWPASEIRALEVRKTIQGPALTLCLASGQDQTLTKVLTSPDELERIAADINRYLDKPAASGKSRGN
jgi:hypothetical protein